MEEINPLFNRDINNLKVQKSLNLNFNRMIQKSKVQKSQKMNFNGGGEYSWKRIGITFDKNELSGLMKLGIVETMPD